jgi:hypothetical protein
VVAAAVTSVDSVIEVTDDATTLTIEPSAALRVLVDPLIDVMCCRVLRLRPSARLDDGFVTGDRP